MKLESVIKKILPVLKKNHVRKAGLFGSVARKNPDKKSDVDILVEFENAISLLEFVRIKHELEDELGKKIDLVEYSTIKPILRERILAEQISIL